MSGGSGVTGSPMAEAYSISGGTWQAGPAMVYERLADELVAASPVSLAGRVVLDVGAGTGAASRAVARAGGTPVACDVADGMLHAARATGVSYLVLADARALPVADGAAGGLVAAFSYNHVPDPVHALAEAGRAVRSGGPILVSAYAADDTHPVKTAVEAACREVGWEPARWLEDFRLSAIPQVATPERAAALALDAGLVDVTAQKVEVAFPDLDARSLVDWRMGMAQHAPFLLSLDEPSREHVTELALAQLGDDVEPLVRRVIVLVASAA